MTGTESMKQHSSSKSVGEFVAADYRQMFVGTQGLIPA
jgi:hypothetical protein